MIRRLRFPTRGRSFPFPARICTDNSPFTVTTFVLLVSCLLYPSNLCAQDFTRLTIDNDVTWARGVSWVDFDNDGDLDLYVTYNDFGGVATFDALKNRNKLFRNDGNDTFVATMPQDMANDTSFSSGQTWADYDNDGNIDLYVANANSIYDRFLSTTTPLGSELFRNLGPQDYLFTRIISGDVSSLNRIAGFAAAWADYNKDGFVDLVITTPSPNFYPNEIQINILFDNNGNGTFTRNTGSAIVSGTGDFYTIPTWSDYDLDGDMDLYITAGPIQSGVQQPDYFFRNLLKESGAATFERDLTSNFATEQRDGQQANWIDFDNDGDLDLYVTNFGGTPGFAAGMRNDFYRNDAGAFTKITSGAAVTDIKISIGQTWGDFDNDGDLDLYVTNATSQSNFGGNDYYQNDGAPNYTFTRITTGDFVAPSRSGWGASSGDYDNDGDLDLYVTINTLTAGSARDALYRNDLNNGNQWLNIKCIGSTSNRSAIGARVRIKATVAGNTFWQMREISSQNASTGHNSLRAHFGLADAAIIDSLIVEWPSGTIDIATNLLPNAFLIAIEGGQISSIDETGTARSVNFVLHQNYPNPFNPVTRIDYDVGANILVKLQIFNLLGEEVRTLVNRQQPAGNHQVQWDGRDNSGRRLASGIYLYRLQAGGFVTTKKLIVLK